MADVSEVIKKPEVSFWIALIVPLIGFAIQWGVLTNKINGCCSKCDTTAVKLEHHIRIANEETRKIDARLAEIQVQLAEIKKDIAYIKTYK